MDNTKQILLIEDDLPTAEMYKAYLVETGFKVSITENFSQSREVLPARHFDLTILDLNLPDGDGIELLKEIRAKSSMPVIIVTNRTEEIDKIVGLELGADDYLVKPVSPRELRLRIVNILRRINTAPEPNDGKSIKDCSGIHLDTVQRQAILPDGKHIDLTNGEFELLTVLFDNAGRPVSRAYLLDKISGYSSDSQSRSIDTLVYRLRHKLKIESGNIIQTVHGFGYKLICKDLD